jgi:small-conductance mechanosensitive channel
MNQGKKKLFAGSVILFLLSSAAMYAGIFRIPIAGSDPNYPTDRFFFCLINAVFWLTGAYLVSKIINKTLWSGFIKIPACSKTLGRIEDFSVTFVYVTALTAVITAVFRLEFSAAVAVVFLAVWLAAALMRKNMLTNFSGSFFNSARPFKTGDRIRLINKNGNLSVRGAILQFDGKAIHLKTEENTRLIFSWAMLDDFIIENYAGVQKQITQFISFEIDSSVPTERGKRILKASAFQALTSPLSTQTTEPVVNVSGYSGGKIEYKIGYSFIPWEEYSPEDAKDKVLCAIAANLNFAGIKQDGALTDFDILSNVSLFNLLEREDRKWLAASAAGACLDAGKEVIKQGEKGDSMYVVTEGLLGVFINADGKDRIKVGRLAPGQFFGEMSLFTGEDRSATVITETSSIVYEIKKDSLKTILEKKPQLAEMFGLIIAERQSANLQKLDDFMNRKDSLIEKIIGKIKSFFEL